MRQGEVVVLCEMVQAKPVALQQRLLENRFHDRCHTAAALVLAQGVHPKMVQERLGHSNIQMTMNLYSHVSRAM